MVIINYIFANVIIIYDSGATGTISFNESFAVTPFLRVAFDSSAGLDGLSLAVTLLLEAALELATLSLS